jgi:DNA repair protein RecN (Recombination protein N)
MIKFLEIQNYALIENLRVHFDRGLNIITGETGAGKSIIVDALSLILGERADSNVVRRGADKSVVEGVFDVTENKNLKAIFVENELEWNDELILRREVSAKGQSRCFVNDSPATLALLKAIGNLLVDLHGQHEHQSLLRSETHIDFLDDFGKLLGLRDEFSRIYHEAERIRKELDELHAKEQQLQEKRALYEFQIQEIDALRPQPGEEDSLMQELTILENAEKLFSVTSQLYGALYEGDSAVYDQLVRARDLFNDLATIDPAFEEGKRESTSALAIVQELAKFLQHYNSRIEFNAERLEQIRERLGHLTLLKKKYGGSVDAILAHRERIGKEVALANNFDSTLSHLHKQFETTRIAASKTAFELSAKRREVAKKVDMAIVKVLKELGMPNARFETVIQQREAEDSSGFVRQGKTFYQTTPKGIDAVEFHISPNAGEELKPLAKIASGGEISRIMLAMKTILAKSDRLPLLVFDEIDVGISGRIAQTVGMNLKRLSQFHQILAITHLPQIAALADSHFLVEKVEDGEYRQRRTVTRMRKLTLEERIREVASLMSGTDVTKAGIAGAKELMGLT